jgi:hypothetical protein
MGNKNTHDKILNPTPRTTKLDTRKKVAILMFYERGRKKTKETDHSIKIKNTNEQTIKKKTAVMMMMMMSLHLAMWVRIEIDGWLGNTTTTTRRRDICAAKILRGREKRKSRCEVGEYHGSANRREREDSLSLSSGALLPAADGGRTRLVWRG